MAKYKLGKEHFLQLKRPDAKPGDPNPWLVEPQLHDKGDVIDWPGTPSLHMEPLDQEAKERAEERRADFTARRAQAAKKHRGSTGWTKSFEENMHRIIVRPEPEDEAPPLAKPGRGRRVA